MLSINEHDIAVKEYLDTQGIKVNTRNHIGAMMHEEWQHDKFYIMIQNKDKPIEGFEYSTGLGHRVKPPKRNGYYINRLSPGQVTEVKKRDKLLGGRSILNTGTSGHQSDTWIVYPTQASVLHALLLDSEANQWSFDDWCDMFGYSDDSIEHLNVYKSCLTNAKKLGKVLTREQIETLRELLEDY